MATLTRTPLRRRITALVGGVGLAAALVLSACQATPPAATATSTNTGAAVASSSSEAAAAPEADVNASSASQIAPQPPVVYAPSGLSVSGEGIVKAAPDMATVSVGVQTRGQTAQEAQAENTRLMTQVVDALEAQGIAEEDILTTGINLYPVYSGENNTIIGYDASNQVTVTVQDVNLAGQILDEAISAGANTAGQIVFGLKDSSKLRQQALQAAVTEARTKADAMAATLGLTVTSVQAVTEGYISGPPVYAKGMGAPAAEMAADAAPVVVQPGELEIRAQVQVVFGFSQ